MILVFERASFPKPLKVMSRTLILLLMVLFSLSGCGDRALEQLKQQSGKDRPYQAYNFENWDLRGMDFSGANLKEVNLRYADLRKAVLKKADLKYADLRAARFLGADFTGSNLPLAQLFEADLRGGIYDDIDWRGYDFERTSLFNTSFKRSLLAGVSFESCDLRQSDFSETDLRQTQFNFAQLTKTKFIGANLTGVDLSNQDLREADFSKANLTGTSFHGSNLEGAKIENAIINGTDFTKANLAGIDFSGAVIESATFKGAILVKPKFNSAQINRINFDGFDFTKASFRGAWIRHTSFIETNLTQADFSFALLEDVLLKNSKLTNANITEADFSKALLYKTDFSGVRFTGALFPTVTEKNSGLIFVQAPMGCYLMGDTFGEDIGFDVSPHRVCLGDFFIAQREVTQEQFEAVMGYNPSYHRNREKRTPVENISNLEADNFIVRLMAKSGWTLRLPTEAEWEYACRDLGGNGRFGNGTNLANPKEIAFNAQMSELGQKRLLRQENKIYQSGLNWEEPVPVGMFKPNRLGLYDMSGNVAELVGDPWDTNAYQQDVAANPKLKLERSAHGVRGGHYGSGASHIRCSKRSFMMDQEIDRRIGFRVVKEITESDLKDVKRFQLE
ncbi:MAG: hypothetical protein A2527_08305 [Candidatus Lambdaproteobacteria bacterium RIFOXYD2_FULL_50_16]|uniref:Sulfatase-modifying factor enzyme-like domain-containing protein n=1 Tax=Candidatus Lambdaproteobacteria bacterium RIFOXYD2_FULL_50_16 TaxID=1817772 RepID=A0A1F6GAP3_9PROT|nr:MAG: hypothetical protein A2527_08305 [Candidatus Lambdaproteobacteria bacterium RIFOXYD2_FULL_50_16]